MILVYAEKEDMGIRYAAALGGINYNGTLVTTENLSSFINNIKKEIADKQGYLETIYDRKKYIVTWGWGHFGKLKDIPDYNPEYDKWNKIPLPFFPPKYEVKRIQQKNEYFRKRDDIQFARIKKMFNSDNVEYIINATDWEREGELIFAYVYDLTGTHKPYYRLRNTAKTEKEIRKAFNNLVSEKENYPYVLSARARSIADWTIGINMTIAGTLYLSKDRSLLNIGRVMTPTLNLIVEREKELKNYVKKTSYGISGDFSSNEKNYKGIWQGELFETENEAKDYIAKLSQNGVITSIKKDIEHKAPPLLHNTNTLQIEANEKFGYTLEETLNIAQKLYENGFITYPRVDSQYLTEDKESEIPDLLRTLSSSSRYKEFSKFTQIPKRYFNNSKIDGHDAIIATDTLPKSLSKEQLDIYDLIVRRMFAAAAPDIIVEKTTIVTEVGTDEFKSNGIKYVDKGWNVVYNRELNDNLLPQLNEGEQVFGTYSTYAQETKPPKRYTDATLIKAMENCGKKVDDKEAREYLKRSKGIGRPATRAALVERLISAGYINREKKQLVPTDKGMNTIDAITIDDIKSPVLTADWEKALDEIELSSPSECVKELKKFMISINSSTKNWCDEMKKNRVEQTGGNNLGVSCPVCNMPLAEGKDNYYCTGYKEGCKFTIRKEISGKKITRNMVKTLIEKGETSEIKDFKGKKPFNAKLILTNAYICPDCKTIQSNDKCYKCGKLLSSDPEMKTIGFKFLERRK